MARKKQSAKVLTLKKIVRSMTVGARQVDAARLRNLAYKSKANEDDGRMAHARAIGQSELAYKLGYSCTCDMASLDDLEKGKRSQCHCKIRGKGGRQGRRTIRKYS